MEFQVFKLLQSKLKKSRNCPKTIKLAYNVRKYICEWETIAFKWLQD